MKMGGQFKWKNGGQLQYYFADIHRNNSVRDFRNGWVIQNNYMVKESCYKLGSTQNCFSGSNTVVNLVKGTGPDFCEGIFPPGLAPQVFADTISDPIMKWESDFGKAVAEINGNNSGTSNPKVNLINCIELVQQLRYQDALALVTSGFADSLDQKFANVLKSYINLYYPEPHIPNAQEELLLREVATLLPSENGSHVYLARSIMKRLFDEDFGELDSYYEDILINLLNTNCVNEINELELLFLNDQNQLVPIQYHIDSNYQIQIFGESLAELNPTKNFTLRLIHLTEEYYLTGTLTQLLQNQNTIELFCSQQMGKKGNSTTNIIEKSISFYPNPSTEQISVTGYDNNYPYFNIQLIDLTGRSVLSLNHWNASKPIEIKNIANGVYIIQISNGEETISQKLIKE
ncbi:MAG: T9SS type A sorting domain-containing protein [Bacteroidetes bacterium]|nr:T9SS type A sorting domain-containing protein [Bacteroidota bacterium]